MKVTEITLKAAKYLPLVIVLALGVLIVIPTYAANTLAPDCHVTLEKYTNLEDADLPTGPVVPIGSTVNWTYEVFNSGWKELTQISVTDDQGVTVSCPSDTLAADTGMTCTAEGIATEGQYENVGRVDGYYTDGDEWVDATDPSHYLGIPLDCGDLPDDIGGNPAFTGLTLLPTGACHELDYLYMGSTIDIEGDGQPDEAATGDDNDPQGNDDDGVTRLGNWGLGTGSLEVFVSGGDGCLFGWLDYSDGTGGDANGEFEAEETILFNYPVTSGLNTIQLANFLNPLPGGAVNGQSTYARFRLMPRDEGGGCTYTYEVNHLDLLTGTVENGEVEDYAWPFKPDAVTLAGFNANSTGTPILLLAALVLLTLTLFGMATNWLRRGA